MHLLGGFKKAHVLVDDGWRPSHSRVQNDIDELGRGRDRGDVLQSSDGRHGGG